MPDPSALIAEARVRLVSAVDEACAFLKHVEWDADATERDAADIRLELEHATAKLLDALSAALEQQQGAEQRAEEIADFLLRLGYRRCDIPICNCNSWHGGHAEARLSEIGESLRDAGVNGGTIHGGVLELIRDKEAAEARLSHSDQSWAVVQQIVQEMRQHAACAFDAPGPDVVTAPQVIRWADRLSGLLVQREQIDHKHDQSRVEKQP